MKKFIIIILISLACETFLFNYNFFITLFNKEMVYTHNSDNPSFEIENINKKVRNIKIETPTKDYTLLKISAKDEGNNIYYVLNQKKISSQNKRSLYQNIHAFGNVKSLNILLLGGTIDKVIINAKIPFMFSFARFLIILIVVSFIYVFNSKSNFYKIKLFDKKSNMIIVGEILVIICMFLGYLCANNEYFLKTNFLNQHQYELLAKSLKEKKLYVKELKDSFLLNMDNPYDTIERYKLSSESREEFLWDYAFYKGKYYVYFGIGPVLLTYLPYYLMTGKDLSNALVNLFFLVGSAFSLTYLLYVICKKWFKDIKLLTFILCTFLLVTSSGVFYVAKRPYFYNVPIIVSIFFVSIGLGLFISATTSKKLFKTKLVIASSCMAFVALCRPQFLIATFLIIPLYYSYFFKDFNKQKLKEFLCIIIPYVIFAIITCAYNYIRFGNILEFGSVYNLTTNDMTNRGLILARIPLGIFYYLIIPTRFIPYFPFIDFTPALVNNYFGRTIYEKTFGGFFFTHAITIICLFTMKFKEHFKDKKLYIFTILCVIFAFVVIMADTIMAGILSRYYMDFSYLFLIPTAIIIFSLEKTILKSSILKKILVVLVFLVITYEFAFLFVDNDPSMIESMPKIYYYFHYLFTFNY